MMHKYASLIFIISHLYLIFNRSNNNAYNLITIEFYIFLHIEKCILLVPIYVYIVFQFILLLRN